MLINRNEYNSLPISTVDFRWFVKPNSAVSVIDPTMTPAYTTSSFFSGHDSSSTAVSGTDVRTPRITRKRRAVCSASDSQTTQTACKQQIPRVGRTTGIASLYKIYYVCGAVVDQSLEKRNRTVRGQTITTRPIDGARRFARLRRERSADDERYFLNYHYLSRFYIILFHKPFFPSSS